MTIGSHEELVIMPAGNAKGGRQNMLHVIFDDEERARVYIRDGRIGGKIISFEVDPEFVREVRANAVKQQSGKRINPGLPQADDPENTSIDVRIRYNLSPEESSGYGLPREWIKGLEKAAKPGTGRIYE